MAEIPTKPTMHGCACTPKHRTANPAACYRLEARKHKPTNPQKNGSAEAVLWKSGKARMRLPSFEIICRCGFP
ncbi:hypothetical protein FZ025_13945 [Xanthomonas hyacinthi]|nr:hypothetical protein FZ025_13945 [Xanthomonas hyacinthi]